MNPTRTANLNESIRWPPRVWKHWKWGQSRDTKRWKIEDESPVAELYLLVRIFHARNENEFQNLPALRNQLDNSQLDSQSELIIPASTSSTFALQQVLPAASTAPRNKHSSYRNHRSPSYYGFENSSPNSEITAPPKKPLRASVEENYQPTNISLLETVETTADQIPSEDNISPAIGNVSPLDPQVCPVVDQRTSTL